MSLQYMCICSVMLFTMCCDHRTCLCIERVLVTIYLVVPYLAKIAPVGALAGVTRAVQSKITVRNGSHCYH